MTTHAETIANLQRALAMELGAVHQYLLHAHTLDNWGLDKLAKRMRAEMQEELGHAGAFIDRIVFLEGEPNLDAAKTPAQARSLRHMFEADLADEKHAVAVYTEAAAGASAAHDIGSRKLFEDTVIDEEGHMDWLQQQLDLLERMGEAAYIAKHSSSGARAKS